MAYLGLVPSEHSSGGTRRQGGITKAGNGAARRMLIEAAWSYRFPARISREQLLRQEGLAKPIRDTAWKARNDCAGGIASLHGQVSHRPSFAISSCRHVYSLLVLQAVQCGRRWARQEARS